MNRLCLKVRLDSPEPPKVCEKGCFELSRDHKGADQETSKHKDAKTLKTKTEPQASACAMIHTRMGCNRLLFNRLTMKHTLHL
jgi:hypothetical protein